MIKTIAIEPGIVLRCFPDRRFKQGSLSVQFVRPMGQEAALNALLPAVLLRGTKHCPDIRRIIYRLDDLYGAAVGALVRRVGDYQTTGLSCSFIDDRFSMESEAILAPMADFLREILLEPALQDGIFREDYVESEKENLILTIEAQRNDKRAYAGSQLLKFMCKDDPFGVPRLGEPEQVAQINAQTLYDHYRRVLAESPVEIFYTGAAQPELIAKLLQPLFAGISRNPVRLPKQTPLISAPGGEHTETMEVTQGKLAMGFVTPITVTDPRFAAMQVLNTLYGSGMVSKLFMKIREQMSLCYDIGSSYYSSKGILTVSAGIDFDKEVQVQHEIMAQLNACVTGEISEQELQAAKESVISGLQAVHDSPGSIEGYYAIAALSGLSITPEAYIRQVEQVTRRQVATAAASLRLHTVYFLRGVQE